MNLVLDDVEYTNVFIRTPIKRTAIIKDSSNSGWTLDGQYKRDIVGTFFNYTFIIDMTKIATETYDALYEVLTNPVESHELQVPYGQGKKIIKVYITSIQDGLVKKVGSLCWWTGLTVNALGAEVVK